MGFHDPRKAVDLLRQHLASHDQSLYFLFGAGTSSSINLAPKPKPGEKPQFEPLVPAVKLLTSRCEAAVKEGDAGAKNSWDKAVAECTAEGTDPNVENILSKIRAKISAMGPDDVSLGLKGDKLRDVERVITSKILSEVSPEEKKIPKRVPHDQFARWARRATRKVPLEVFTTNYDILLERSLERAEVPVFDGFIGSYEQVFYPESFESHMSLPKDWVRLWKIHGSVNWSIESIGTRKRILKASGGEGGGLILPSHLKYDESRKLPYQAYIDRLSTVLRQPALLVTCGFSFTDQHINAVILEGLERNPLAHVICLYFDDLPETSPLTVLARERKTFLVFGRNAAIISRQWAPWRLSAPVDRRTAPFMDLVFDSYAQVEKPDEAHKGTMRLGDFGQFCKFLASMNIADEQGSE